MSSLLYPPPPAGVPADLAKADLHYRLQVVRVLVTLSLLLLLYVALLVGALGLMYWATFPPSNAEQIPNEVWQMRVFVAVFRVSVFALAAMLFTFLVKGFFKRGEEETSQYVQVAERDQPKLFYFLRSLCQEIGCPVPARVYLNHEVNAAVFYPTSILNLFVSPEKNLLIGLGLVNGLNVVEFKALLAHELGHFSQRTLRLDGYVSVAFQVLANMVNTRDRWDDWVVRGFSTPWVSAFAVLLYALAEWTRGLLKAAFRVVRIAHLSLRRQREFNADLVAVSAAGSDAVVYLLLKANFLQECLRKTQHDLTLAAEEGLFTRDVFFHQHRAADLLRTLREDPNLGRPPELSADSSPSLDVFKPGDQSALAMWADHPSDYDREQNAKRRYFRSPHDDRPAWLLLDDQETLREETAHKFYANCLHLTPAESLSDPECVQAFLDDEHASTHFEPRYRGIYNNRYLELEDCQRLIVDAQSKTPPTSEDLDASLHGMYSDQLEAWLANHRRRQDEVNLLEGLCSGRDKPADGEFEFRGQRCSVRAATTLLDTVYAELNEDCRYLADFDRSVFSVHYQFAVQLAKQDEFLQRYEFQLRVQQLCKITCQQQGQMESVLDFLLSAQQVRWEDVNQIKEVLAQVQKQLTEIFDHASSILIPPLKHLRAGEPLADRLGPRPDPLDVTSSDINSVLDMERLYSLQRQLAMLVDRMRRIVVKSCVGILEFHAQLVAEWSQSERSGVLRSN